MSMSELSGYDYINMNDFSTSLSNNSNSISDVSSSTYTTIKHNTTSYIYGEDIIVPLTIKSENDTNKVLCMRCGKPLTDSKSRLLGMGPSCYKQYQKDKNRLINLFCLKDFGSNKKDED